MNVRKRGTEMVWKTFFFTACLMAVLTPFAGLAHSAPPYTDRETALALAEALDKGVFQNHLITSTFIQSAGTERFFVKVILDNGAEENWDLRQLRRFTQGNSLVLRNNSALLFPEENSNKFVVFNKNTFSRRALAAKVYVKEYGPSDVLEGQKLSFGIHQFNLVELVGQKKSLDEAGYPRHYILDLENGNREQLSFLEAYLVLERDGLVTDPGSSTGVLRAPYKLREIKKHELPENSPSGTGLFGVEMVFDRPVALEPGHFPFRIYETRSRGASNFVVEIIAPNTTLAKPLPSIDTLEFLHDIQAVSDPSHTARVLLRAMLNPEVMNFPPQVAVQGQSVMVSFTKVVDQSVTDQQAIKEAGLRARQERMLSRTLSPEEVEQRKNYRTQMEEGRSFIGQVGKAKSFTERLELYESALASYSQAAVNASSDRELQKAIAQRNALMVKVPQTIVDYVSRALRKGMSSDAGAFKQWLERAAIMTRDTALRNAILRLLRDPNLG